MRRTPVGFLGRPNRGAPSTSKPARTFRAPPETQHTLSSRARAKRCGPITNRSPRHTAKGPFATRDKWAPSTPLGGPLRRAAPGAASESSCTPCEALSNLGSRIASEAMSPSAPSCAARLASSLARVAIEPSPPAFAPSFHSSRVSRRRREAPFLDLRRASWP